MDSFSKRRPPKFSEPIDFNLKASEFSHSNLLVDRFNGLFSSGWSTNDQHGLFNFSGNLNSTSNLTPAGTTGVDGNGGGLYSSNLTHAINGINSNPFNTKGLNSYDYNNQWIAPPRSCPPIGTRDLFSSFSVTPRNHINSNHLSNTNNNQINSHNYNSINPATNSNRDNTNNYHNNLTTGHQQHSTNPNTINNNTNNSFGIGNNNNHHSMVNSSYNNSDNSLAANSTLNGLQASYVPPRVRRRNPTCTECVFCKNNGHPPAFYKSHILKCPEGNIICPVLRCYNCPICQNGGGAKAHTLRYCPWNKPSFWQRNNRP
ncbi:GATA zinc finger domain-containing protein 15-like [Panonychus citri]|uniref:GATA zinc finger domain-containing protein 15-like n=1 Tax=Panonychus citri TaxID=50023 RepID=UPI002307EFD9|nr:GATA zinc finger domain-containing protein 15-like [Panonychus citri]